MDECVSSCRLHLYSTKYCEKIAVISFYYWLPFKWKKMPATSQVDRRVEHDDERRKRFPLSLAVDNRSHTTFCISLSVRLRHKWFTYLSNRVISVSICRINIWREDNKKNCTGHWVNWVLDSESDLETLINQSSWNRPRSDSKWIKRQVYLIM